jgi:hypothetical protein
MVIYLRSLVIVNYNKVMLFHLRFHICSTEIDYLFNMPSMYYHFILMCKYILGTSRCNTVGR